MATRNVTYQFEWGFVTYDRITEADAVAQIEADGQYLAKFDVNTTERALIDDSNTEVVVRDDSLVLIPEGGEVRIVS